MEVDFSKLTAEEMELYVEAWQEVGGTMSDVDCATPWCCPWLWAPTTDLPVQIGCMKELAKLMLDRYPEARAEEE